MTAAYVHSRTIEFAETDLAGIVHFSNFFRFMESAEAAFLRSLSFSLHDAQSDHAWPRVHCECHYLQPVHFGDVLETRLYVARLGRSSIEYRFAFYVGQLAVAEGACTVVHVRLDRARNERKADRLPEALRAKFEPLLDFGSARRSTCDKELRP